MRIKGLYIGLCLSLALLASCHNDDEVQHNMPPQPSQKEVENQLIKSHKEFVKQEQDEITQYIAQHKYDMQTTTTGIHYQVYEHGNGIQPTVGDRAKVSYKVSLLDGTVCYDSKTEGPKEFTVGKDAVESGVHEVVQLMHVGDKGLFIVPSNLAHGLVGDRDKIPPGSVVIYDLNLLSVTRQSLSSSK